jgi:23S rRNA (adenine2030-N6)-methyltransferase
MARILDKGDRLVCFELHPREAEALKASMAEIRGEKGGRPIIEVRWEDGPAGLKSLLPPPSRRGLILIDPSWEEQSEYESIPRSVQSGLKRFPEGTFIIWYPLLALPKGKAAVSSSLPEVLFGLSDGKRCRVELCTGTVHGSPSGSSPRGMYGSGLVIFNPPWTLRSALEETLPYLAKVLGNKDGSWHLEWI